MRYVKLILIATTVLALLVCGCERKVTEQVTKSISPSDAAYLGSEACSACHAETYASFAKTGHPFKLNEAEDAQQASYYPFSTVPDAPAVVSWDQVDKVIGGFWWKARFIGMDGYIITGDEVQYNLATEEWVGYQSGKTVKYDCGPCHMTAYKDVGNQEGKEGLVGTWEFGGIQCEECHGPGEIHASDPYNVTMVIDRSNEACGKCHIRGDVAKIPASGGFIKHHEQWNEMFTTKHSALDCVSCHDVHVSLHPLNADRASAIKVTCEGCHFEETASFKASSINHDGSAAGPDCIDCHMARAAKSAVAAGPYEGDIRSHLFRINTSVDAEMFTADGAYANGYLTLEYTCLTCHASKDKAWAAAGAGSVHATPSSTAKEYVGSEVCSACHETKYNSFMLTGHPFKLNEADDVQNVDHYPYTTVDPPPGYTWDDIDKVIGGFRWKARFIANDGYIITGDNVQYNFETDEYVAYQSGQTAAYDCGPCHMTGYKDTGNQEGKPGLVGTWAYGGVQCEECHGPGSAHVGDAYNVDMIVDRSSEGCGKCHIRGDVTEIPASGGFVKHHEQWNEMFGTKHSALDCIDCHDVHIGLHPDNPDRASAIKVTCQGCHLNATQSFLASTIDDHLSNENGPDCIDCHMPLAAKSAVAVGTYEGDVRSHMFRINTDVNAQMFNITGTLANGYLTLEYTCLKCHDGEDKTWAATHAGRAHNPNAIVIDDQPDIVSPRISQR